MRQTTDKTFKSPVVIGGLGGSGTRVVAKMLLNLDFYLGSYMNEQYDNLWFTFLCRRPKAFHSFNDKKIASSIRLFDSIMKNNLKKNLDTRFKLYSIVAEFILQGYVKGGERNTFPIACANSILRRHDETIVNDWGWKEPNSLFFIEPLHHHYPGMKFIHILRHPMDMVYGNNFQQLYNWHKMFGLPAPNDKNQGELMLSFYEAANTQAMESGKRLLGDNFLVLKFEDICNDKTETVRRLLEFLDVKTDEKTKLRLTSIPKVPETQYRYKKFEWGKLQGAEDVCQKFGYSI